VPSQKLIQIPPSGTILLIALGTYDMLIDGQINQYLIYLYIQNNRKARIKEKNRETSSFYSYVLHIT
jgi:hypothetical protein